MHSSPTLDFKNYPTHLILFLLNALNDLGVPLEPALRGSDINYDEILDEKNKVSGKQILTVIRNIAEFSPEAAFVTGNYFHISSCGIYGFAMLSSPTREDIVNIVIKYHPLIDPLISMEHEFGNDYSSWKLSLNFACAPSDPVYRFILELKLFCFYKIILALYGDGTKINKIKLSYQEPDNYLSYQKIFGCDILFNQDINEIILLNKNSLEIRPGSDAITHKTMLELCEQELQKMKNHVNVEGRVLALLAKYHRKFPGIEEVSTILGMHVRTLRRRLAAEGTAFSTIFAKHRMELAMSHLRSGNLSSSEIAVILGYSDAANFRRAFISWAGITPRAFRSFHCTS